MEQTIFSQVNTPCSLLFFFYFYVYLWVIERTDAELPAPYAFDETGFEAATHLIGSVGRVLSGGVVSHLSEVDYLIFISRKL